MSRAAVLDTMLDRIDIAGVVVHDRKENVLLTVTFQRGDRCQRLAGSLNW